MSERKRPPWKDYFAKLALVTCTRSTCERLQVGCVLVKDNRIISQGYNGYLSGCEHKQVIRDGHEIATIHAEQNAVTDCAKRGVSCDGATAYITHYPCYNCSKLLCASGIKYIKYINDYRNDEMTAYFCEKFGVSLEKCSPTNL